MFSQNIQKNQEEWMIVEENIDTPASIVFSPPSENRLSLTLSKNANEESIFHDTVMLVVDTNFVISHLSLISDLSKQCEVHNYIILFPWATIQELDGLKSTENTYAGHKEQDMAFLVRKAMDFIYRSLLQKGNSIRGQKMTEIIDASLTGDDSILDCCRYWHEKRLLKTILLSNDKNLAIKVMIHGIHSISYEPHMTLDSLMLKISKKLEDYDEPQNIYMEIDEMQEDLCEQPICPEYTLSNYIEQNSVSENDTGDNTKKDTGNIMSFKDFPLPDSYRPFLMELLDDIASTLLKACEPLLKRHMSRLLGSNFSAEYLLKGCIFPPKCLGDLFQIIQKYWSTIFKELFRLRAYEENITEMAKTYKFWFRWASLGIGIGPSSIQELLNWVEEVITFWTLLATETVETAPDAEAERLHATASWRARVNDLERLLNQ